MKKIFVKIASIVMIFVMCLSSLVGCGLVTTDTERDMNQEVATVQIDKGAPKDVIYKKDMIMSYLNYGYMYEQYYGYTSAQTFELIIDSLVNNRIFVQSIIKAQYEDAKGWNVENYLSEDAKLEATYATIKSMNDFVESYIGHDHAAHSKVDTAWETVRTVPTNATNKVKELTKEEKQAYVNEGIKMENTAEFRNAYNKVIELLRVNELLGDYKVNDLTSTDYYKETLKDNQEGELINAFQKSIKDEVIAKFTKDASGNVSLDKLNTAYLEKVDAQKALSTSELADKFSSATSAEPILVGANGNYGYVYNLLLGADDVLKAEITNIKTENKNISKKDYAEARREILEATVITDQRSSWITSGYDFNGEKFENDYTFAIDANNSLKFYGDVEKIRDKDDEHEELYDRYKVTSLKQFNLAEFVAEMEKYVYGAEKTGDSGIDNPSVYKRVTSQDAVEEYSNKINELLFAFSTDPGSLNTYKGYVIKPAPEGADDEEYMQEFADGARELITLGGTSYIMVATDYGYHVMFYSEILNADYGFASLTDYLNSLYGEKSWTDELAKMIEDWDNVEDTENYLYLIANSLFSGEATNAVNKYQRDTLNTYRYSENGGVTLYKDRYADLLA